MSEIRIRWCWEQSELVFRGTWEEVVESFMTNAFEQMDYNNETERPTKPFSSFEAACRYAEYFIEGCGGTFEVYREGVAVRMLDG